MESKKPFIIPHLPRPDKQYTGEGFKDGRKPEGVRKEVPGQRR